MPSASHSLIGSRPINRVVVKSSAFGFTPAVCVSQRVYRSMPSVCCDGVQQVLFIEIFYFVIFEFFNVIFVNILCIIIEYNIIFAFGSHFCIES